MDLVYFVLLVGVLIFVHELGHFAWAKFFGVRVLKFSIGFGPTIAGIRRGDTEYVIAGIPLGGYVRMQGELVPDDATTDTDPRAFHRQPLWKRVVVVSAGPAMNLLFPIVLYFVVFLGDRELLPPVVGTVFPGRPADGKLEAGDVVTSIEGEAIHSFNDLQRIVGANAGRPLRFEVLRGSATVTQTITPVQSRRERDLDLYDEIGRIGVMPHHPSAVIGLTSPSGPAALAGLSTFDVVTSIGGRPVRKLLDLERALDANRGTMVPISFLRPIRVRAALGGLIDYDVFEPRLAQLTPHTGAAAGLTRAGLESADLFISDVEVGSPEHRAGLLPGDRLTALDGEPVRLWTTFLESLRAKRGDAITLGWRRGDVNHTATLRLRNERGVTEYGQRFDRYVLSIRHWLPQHLDPLVPNRAPVSYALRESIRSTYEMAELTVFSIVRLVQGRVTMKSIGGVISVFEVAGTAAREGAMNYLSLMAFISINLGLINLLPIPLLDGGHLLFFGIEAVTRRNVPAKVRQVASVVGLAILVMLMVLAFKNDLERQWTSRSDSTIVP